MASQEMFQSSGRTPLRVYNKQPTYNTYISPYGPKYVVRVRSCLNSALACALHGNNWLLTQVL
jgi:hypothetical protein